MHVATLKDIEGNTPLHARSSIAGLRIGEYASSKFVLDGWGCGYASWHVSWLGISAERVAGLICRCQDGPKLVMQHLYLSDVVLLLLQPEHAHSIVA